MLKRSTTRCGALAVLLWATMAIAPAAWADDLSMIRQLAHDLNEARQITQGRGVTVAIVSSGVDGSVGSLRGKVKPGKDFVNSGSPKRTDGTLVASLVAGSGITRYSPVGMRGLASGVDVLPVRVYPDENEAGHDRFYRLQNYTKINADGIRYAADQGAQIILVDSYSWGGFEQPLEAAVSYATSKNALVVAGAFRAEGAESIPVFPAAAPGAIGVAALDPAGRRMAKFTGRNSSVMVGAPGFDLPAIGPGNSMWTIRGGVPAAAWVAAAAAMVRAEHPTLTPVQVAEAIRSSAHHPSGGYNTEVGFGAVNPIGALRAAERLEKTPKMAQTSKNGFADTANFDGRPPAPIEAVRHSTIQLAGFGAAALAGLIAIALSVLLGIRGRRRSGANGTSEGAPPEHEAESEPEVAEAAGDRPQSGDAH